MTFTFAPRNPHPAFAVFRPLTQVYSYYFVCVFKMSSHYTIPTIPQNLTKEETIVQIVEVLDHLNAVTQDIFSQVNKRIQINSDKLSNILKRVDTAASKVELLKGDKKAKTVFSSSKYPAVDVNHDYVSIFKDISEIKLKRHEVKHTKYLSTYEPFTKLQFYHVKMPIQKNSNLSEGLGDVPGDVKWVNDLLLFNSGKNVYTDFNLMNSLKGPEKVGFKEYNTASELGAAPFSISQRSSLQQTNKETYFYTPKAEELPALDVPLDLPDLPGIADDLRYEIEFGSSIAPSAIHHSDISNVSLDLPDIMDIKATSENSHLPPLPPDDITEPPVQQPPLKNSVISLGSEDNGINNSSLGSIILPDTTMASEQTHIGKLPTPPVITPTNDDSRASLMDAIRKAGGAVTANLKKTNQSKPTATHTSTTSGDLMADLHSKLMMRRKGISGAKNIQGGGTNAVSPDSTLARISSLIPPPAVKSDVESSVSTDDEEWNDDE